MLNRSTVLGAMLLAGALFIVGCGDNSSSATTTTTAGGATTTTASGATTTTAAGATTTTAATSGGTTIALASNSTIGQSILVDSSGKTLYLYDPDGSSTTSKVPAAIAANWPPVAVTGTATAGTGLDASKLSSAMQADGTNQAIYNGHLLYTFAGDSASGDAAGEGLGGVWFVISASGDKISS